MEYYRNPHAATPGLLVRDAGLLLLRLAAASSLILWHGMTEGQGAWDHVWKKTPWIFRDSMDGLGFPFATPVSIAAVCAGLLGSLFIAIGLLSRVSAIVLLVCAVTGALLYVNYPAQSEALGLYAVIYLVIALCGPGRFSLDGILTRK